MSSVLALRQLGNSLKYSSTVKNYGNLLRNSPLQIPLAQCMATKVNSKTTNTPAFQDEWRIIYRLPLIRLASAFNRVKIPYGILNGLTIPAAFALEQASQLPPTTAMLISAVGLTSWCTLAISSLFVRNLIGIIYVNDSNDKMKLAYVDYWGKRHDVCFNVDDVIPESEKSRPAKFDFYQSLRLYSDDKVNYKLLQRFGSIEDPETFVTIFGE
ncbi:transmembrane protein 186 [Lucilia cuprina]|uniref:transmembrane protein 186 n=1 Tax=Lucilia cuprina TaxID=7375 RepID=UPI001F06C167|nr:transmembrane protein 186 [Lucilia cuprina]